MNAERRTAIALQAAYQAEQASKEMKFCQEFVKRSGITADKYGAVRRIAVIPRAALAQGRQINKPQEGDPEYLEWVLRKHPEFLLPKE